MIQRIDKGMPYLVAFVLFVFSLAGYRIFSDPLLMDLIGDAMTLIVRPLAIPVVKLMSSQAFVFVASAIIFFSAVVVCLYYAFSQVLPGLRELGALEAAVRAVSKDPAAHHRSAEDVISKIAPIFAASPALGAAWKSFQHDLRYDGRIPAKTFSVYAAQEPSRRGQGWDALMRALPGYYVSIGLIFTFLGLVVALYIAARGMRLAGADDARAAIINLLNVASFKFLTSVAAISSALLISIAWKSGVSRIQRARRLAIAEVETLLDSCRSVGGISADSMVKAVFTKLDRIIDLLAMQVLPTAVVGQHGDKVTAMRNL